MKKYLFVLSALFIFGCSSEPKEKAGRENADSAKKDTAKTAMYKIYSLPAAMQIPTAIKGMKGNFSEEYLKPTNTKDVPASTNFSKAVNMGMYGIDMGYCLLYEQNQLAIKYVSRIARLADELKITGAFEANVIDRLKNQVANKDSASYLLLSSFNNARNFLRDNKRNEVGYLIAGGSFVEGLHLVSAMGKKNKSKEMTMLIGQQKLFLDNIVELLVNYESQADIKSFNDKLKDLKKVYDQVTIEYEPASDPSTQKIKDIRISDEQIASIAQKTEDIRQSLVQ